MAELSLQGHGSALAELTDQSKMTAERLTDHIEKLSDIRRQAIEDQIGRQAEVASRLLTHFTFEQSQRAGEPADEFAAIIASQDFSGSDLESASA